MVIQHNMLAMNANRQYKVSTKKIGKNTEKLSSGYKINRAADDAAGLTISEKLRNQIRGLNQASDNAQDGISLVQTADGALGEIQSIIQRMRELAVKGANDTNQSIDRNAIQDEIDQLTSQVQFIGENTQFNKINLLDGTIQSIYDDDEELSNAEIIADLKAGNYTSITMDLKVNGNSISGDVVNALFSGMSNYLLSKDLQEEQSGAADIDTMINYISQMVSNTASYREFTADTASYDTAISSVQSYLADSSNATKYTSALSAITDAVNSVGGSGNEATAYTNTMNAIADSLNVLNGGITASSAAAAAVTSITASNSALSSVDAALRTAFTSGDENDVVEAYKALQDVIKQSAIESGNVPGVYLQIGANQGQDVLLNVRNSTASGLRLWGQKVDTFENAGAAIERYDYAIGKVSSSRAKLGAYQNRLEYTTNNLDNSAENLTAAESRIRDVDMADEMVQYSKNNILMQAGQAMIAQANNSTQGVLSLIQ